MFSFNPNDWYWAADDGRVYSSDKNALVQKDDARLTAWLAKLRSELGPTCGPTVWPRDDKGDQTDAALAAVLKPYELSLGAD